MFNNQYIEQAKNFWADEAAFAEAPCIKCGDDDCDIVCSLQEDDSFLVYSVDHDYKVTISRNGEWNATCEFSEFNDGEKIFWNHAAKLYSSIPMWMLENYRGIDVDEVADLLYDDDEDDYDIWGYDEEDDFLDEEDFDDDDLWEDDDVIDADEPPFEPTTSWENLSVRQPIAGLRVKMDSVEPKDKYVSPFTNKIV